MPLSRTWTRLLLFLRVGRLPKCARCSFRLLNNPVRCKEEKITRYLVPFIGWNTTSTGPWTNYESVLLSSVMKLISLTDVSPSAENYSKLFNFVVGSNLKQHMHSTPSSKTATQIAAKLAHFGKKREVAYARLTKENMQ